MTAPAAELQRAIFETLASDTALVSALGGNRIYAEPPANVAFPYIGFGRTSIYDWSTGAESATEQLFTLHIWSKAKGEAEALEIMEIAKARLADASLGFGDHRPIGIKLEFAEVRYDEDQMVHHGLLRLRAVAEPPF